MSVSSTSTRAQVIAEIADCVNYRINESTSEALRLEAAINLYLAKYLPSSSGVEGASISWSTRELKDMAKEARQYADSVDGVDAGGPGCRHLSAAEFRE